MKAEAAYVAVQPYDRALAPVRDDVQKLEAAIGSLAIPAGSPLATVVAAAEGDLANARSWLAVESVSTANVSTALKIGVDSVLQTTVEQLNSVLPDGSAFAKISITPTLTKPPQQNPVPASATAQTPTPMPAPAAAPVPGVVPQAIPIDPSVVIKALAATLQADMNAAKARIDAIGPLPQTSQLQTFNCAVAPLQSIAPLQVSLSPLTLTTKLNNTLVATISGGTAPYFPTITADTAGTPTLTPANIGVPQSVTGTTVTLTNQKQIGPGQYTLVITDSANKVATAIFTETAPPPAARPAPAKSP